jgi:hypothetical protein
MKQYLQLILLLTFSISLHAEINPLGDPAVYTKDTSSTNLPATYGASGNSYAASLNGKKDVCILNGSSTKIYATTSKVSNCTSAPDKFVIPASGASCFNNVRLSSNFCVRSSNGTISTGVIDVVLW